MQKRSIRQSASELEFTTCTTSPCACLCFAGSMLRTCTFVSLARADLPSLLNDGGRCENGVGGLIPDDCDGNESLFSPCQACVRIDRGRLPRWFVCRAQQRSSAAWPSGRMADAGASIPASRIFTRDLFPVNQRTVSRLVVVFFLAVFRRWQCIERKAVRCVVLLEGVSRNSKGRRRKVDVCFQPSETSRGGRTTPACRRLSSA